MEAKWIPVKYHETDDGETVFDCEMPKDREEIFVTVKDCYGAYAFRDYCEITGNNTYYLEDGWEDGWSWYGDVVAWMPAENPEPYKEE